MRVATDNSAFNKAFSAHAATLPAGANVAHEQWAFAHEQWAFARGWEAAAAVAYEACRSNKEGGQIVVATTIDEKPQSIISRQCAGLVAVRTAL